MRVRSGVFAGLIASLTLLGACAREPMEAAYVEPAPEAGMADPAELAGGPSSAPPVAVRESADDAYLSHLASKGLIAERRMDPDTGRWVLVISNRPVPNPVLFGGPRNPRRHADAGHRSRASGTLAGGRARGGSTSPSPAPTSTVASSATPPATDSAAATQAPVATAEAAPAAAAPAPAQPVQVADPARAGFEMTPTLWGIAGAILLALLALLFLANRPKPRERVRYSSHQAPAEASGGDHSHA